MAIRVDDLPTLSEHIVAERLADLEYSIDKTIRGYLQDAEVSSGPVEFPVFFNRALLSRESSYLVEKYKAAGWKNSYFKNNILYLSGTIP